MPLGDGTGPDGLGPRTGRGLGYCSGYGRPGYTIAAPGRRFFGRGRRFWRAPAQPITLTKEQEKEELEAEIKDVESELKALKEALKKLE